MKDTEYFVLFQRSVVVPEEHNVVVDREELIGTVPQNIWQYRRGAV